jgi:2-phosphosulfolactate phosphatase
VTGWAGQAGASVRLEWGAAAIEHLAGDVDCVVVVDVMSFSTCVDVAVARGASVYPYPWRDAGVQAYARERGAEAAAKDRRLADGWSLSPTSLASVPAGLRLVLPSPNGSTIAFAARDRGVAVFCGGLRNRLATARACARFRRVLVVACGERWPDGSLRPALEDLIGAGGLVAALGRGADVSPEARAAALAYQALGEDRRAALGDCASARELVERGFGADVALCLDEEASDVAARLEPDCFVPA